MSPLLDIGTVLKEQYEIIDVFGSAEGTAAYLTIDLITQERLLVWESQELFGLRSKPPGIREYFEREGLHYLVLRVEGQTLGFMLTIAGRIDELSGGLWMLQICRALGYWHKRQDGPPLICLKQGSLSLSDFRLTGADQVMIPSYGDLGRSVQPTVAADALRFSAPEQELEAPSPASDVYALGAMLYCLLTGEPPLEPEERLTRQAKLVPPRKINADISRDMEKVALKALQLDPGRRYPTAAEMAAALESIIIPQLEEEPESEEKPSLLMKLAPYVIGLMVLACLFAIVQGLTVGFDIKIPLFKGPPTPTFTPAPPGSPRDTPTASPTPTAAVTATSIPAVKLVLNQIRTDQFPQMIAYASVLDEKQDPVLDLSKEQFLIRQDSMEVLYYFVKSVDAAQDPLSMVVVMDVSGSMKGEPLEKARTAAADFVGRFDAADNVSLMKFDHEIELVHDFTTDKGAIIEAIHTLSPRGDTALYDVIAHSVTHLAGRPGRRAIVILTDGRDTASTQYSLEGAIAEANQSSLPVFVVGLDSEQFTPEIMEQISSGTGGDYLFAPSPDELDSLYQKIRGQLQNQYRIEFPSRHPADDATHVLYIGLATDAENEVWSDKEYQVP